MLTLRELRQLRDVLDYLPMAPKWLATRDVPRSEVENAKAILDTAIREASVGIGERIAARMARPVDGPRVGLERVQVMREAIASELHDIRETTPILVNRPGRHQ